MADSAAVRKQKAAIKARGLKAGYSGSKSSVDATFRRKQERAKARGKSAAAHAKAPGQIKKLPAPPSAKPGSKAYLGPPETTSAKPGSKASPKTMPTGISTVQTSGIRAKAMAAKAMAAKPSKAQIDSVAAKAKSMTPGKASIRPIARPMTPGKASIRPIARPKAPSGPAKNMQAHKGLPGMVTGPHKQAGTIKVVDPVMSTMPIAPPKRISYP